MWLWPTTVLEDISPYFWSLKENLKTQGVTWAAIFYKITSGVLP